MKHKYTILPVLGFWLLVAAPRAQDAGQTAAAEKYLAPFMANPSLELADPNNADAALGWPGIDKQTYWSPAGARTGALGIKMSFSGESGACWYAYAGLGGQPKILALDKLYRYSFWYKTAQEVPQPAIIQIHARPGPDVYYPSVSNWTWASGIFSPKKVESFGMVAMGVKNGDIRYIKDRNGKNIPQDAINLTVYADDFDLREIGQDDFDRELVPDGGFESGDKFPAGWWGAPRDAATLDSKEKYAGEKSLKMSRVPGGGVSANANLMPLLPDTVYLLSFRAKSDRVETLFKVRLIGDGKDQYDFQEHRLMTGRDWQKFLFAIETRKETPPEFIGGLSFWLFPRTQAEKDGGILWIDDVSFRKF